MHYLLFTIISLTAQLTLTSSNLTDCDYDGSLNHLRFVNQITFTDVVDTSPIHKIHQKVSNNDLEILDQAIQFYGSGEFKKSLNLNEKLYNKYPDDLFILEYYARTLYRFDDKKYQSYKLYQILIKKVNNYGYEEISALTNKKIDKTQEAAIYISFFEAYWKLGCLYLDHKKYQEALIEFSKVMLIINSIQYIAQNNQRILIDCYNYLTETTYYLKQKDKNNFFYCRAKKFDPNNTYVDNFLLK